MSERREKLRFGATFVVWAARMLTLGEKVVWYHHWALDRSRPGQSNGDHCYMSAASMAERLGLSPYTVEEYRSHLVHMGLMESFRRQGATNRGWVALLPDRCHPRTEEVAGPEGVRLAGALDEHIGARLDWLVQQGKWPAKEVSERRTAASRSHIRRRAGAPSDSGHVARAAALGGRGEHPTSASVRETQLPPAVREDGVGARALEAEDGAHRRSAEEAERRGWAMIREAARRRAAGT